MARLSRILWSALILWAGYCLVVELGAGAEASRSPRPYALAPQAWSLGSPYVGKVREFTREAAAKVPDGAVLGLIANQRLAPGQRPILQMWMAYLMPRQHIHLLPRYPLNAARALEAAGAGSYLLAYRCRPARIPNLEVVFEHPLGGVYRVAR